MTMLQRLTAVTGAAAVFGGIAMGTTEPGTDDAVSKHLVAEAMLTAHFVDAALRAGMDRSEIEAVLRRVAAETVISEFWVSDSDGTLAFSSVEGADFTFATDPEAGTQAAPFAVLLAGDGPGVVVQGPQPRDLDGAVFRYVGVAGVDRPRIVQVGLAAGESGRD